MNRKQWTIGSLSWALVLVSLLLMTTGCTIGPVPATPPATTTPSTSTSTSSANTPSKVTNNPTPNTTAPNPNDQAGVIGLDGEVITNTGQTPATSTTSSSGQQSIALNVPIYNQLDPANGPLGEIACGPTCLAMVLAFMGINVPVPQLMQECNVSQDKGGCEQTDMLAAGRLHSPNTQIYEGKDANWVRQMVLTGKPIIVTTPTHYMVCTGVDEAGNFLINDPWEGQRRVMSPAEFANEYDGAAVTV